MHGRNRADYKALQRDNAAKLAQKASQWHALSTDVRDRRRSHDHSETTLQLTEKLLTVNPDPLYLWNHRRELLLFRSKEQSQSQSQSHDENLGESVASSMWQSELQLTLTALQNNPKAYGAWFHRKWTLLQLLSGDNQDAASHGDDDKAATREPPIVNPAIYMQLLESELLLVEQLLQADERNFHGWNYRRFVVSCQLQIVSGCSGGFNLDDNQDDDGSSRLPDGSWPNYAAADFDVKASLTGPSHYSMGPQVALATKSKTWMDGHGDDAAASYISPEVHQVLQQEWNYSLAKIMENFSNFSAFHYRSKLLPLMLLLATANAGAAYDDGGSSMVALAELIPNELEMVENAVFTEPDDQTAWWYQNFLFDFITSQSNSDNDDSTSKSLPDWFLDMLQAHIESLRELVEEVDSQSKWPWLGLLQALEHLPDDTAEERQQIIKKLIIADPDRQGRYQYMLRKLEG